MSGSVLGSVNTTVSITDIGSWGVDIQKVDRISQTKEPNQWTKPSQTTKQSVTSGGSNTSDSSPVLRWTKQGTYQASEATKSIFLGVQSLSPVLGGWLVQQELKRGYCAGGRLGVGCGTVRIMNEFHCLMLKNSHLGMLSFSWTWLCLLSE